MSLKQRLSDPLKLLCYQAVYLLVKSIPARRRMARLVLVKTDEIGDYMLVRNVLGKFRESARYAGYHITFVGNIHCRPLFEAFDTSIADEAIWLDKLKFRRNLFYRFGQLLRIRRAGFSDAVNLVYSRSWRLDDGLVAVSTSANNLAMQTTDVPPSRLERRLTPAQLYTHIEEAGGERVFDAIRNSRFVHGALEMSPEPVTTGLNSSLLPAHFLLPRPYFVLFPGSGHKDKRWPSTHFAVVARAVAQRYQLNPVICGSVGDRQETKALAMALGDLATDWTGRTSLTDLLAVLKGAHCLISVDTGAVHLAAAVGCPVFGLFSGFHYGRFAPYPATPAVPFFAIYPDGVEEQIRSGRLRPGEVAVGGMAKIPVEKVLRVIEENLID